MFVDLKDTKTSRNNNKQASLVICTQRNIKMEKLPMCRICLVQNVRMSVVVNKHLRVLYEKLTDAPFVTEDSRPIVACFFCCAKLKQCYRLLRQCLKAEELFTQMKNGDYEPNLLINQEHFEFNGLTKSPTENLSIAECHTESYAAIKEELPAVCEGLDDIIEPKEEDKSDELEPENVDCSCLDVADTQPPHSESDSEDDVSLMDFKIEEEEGQEVFRNILKARETKRTTVAEKPNLRARRTKPNDAITAEQMRKDQSDTTVIQTVLKRTSTPDTYFKEPYKCGQRSVNQGKKIISHTRTQTSYKCDVCQRSFSRKGILTNHIRIHTGDKHFKCDVCQRSFSRKGILTNHIRIHTGEKPFRCDICQCSFRQKGFLKDHIRIHTGEKPFKCDTCQSSFRQKGTLKKHIRTHIGEKPFRCDICQCSFRQKGILKNHIRIHTGDKPFKCDICQRSFSVKSGLTNHIRIHTGDKPFKCDICQCSFRQKGTLKKHIRIHTGEKP